MKRSDIFMTDLWNLVNFWCISKSFLIDFWHIYASDSFMTDILNISDSFLTNFCNWQFWGSILTRKVQTEPKSPVWFCAHVWFLWKEARAEGSHLIQIIHRVCLKNLFFSMKLNGSNRGREGRKVLQKNPKNSLNEVWPPGPPLFSQKLNRSTKSY